MTDDWEGVPSRPTDFTCPECNGALRELEDGGPRLYRCRVGHAFSEEALLAAKDDSVEEALWLALQTLQERAQMLSTMARHERESGRERSALSLEERGREADAHAQRLRDFVARLGRSAA